MKTEKKEIKKTKKEEISCVLKTETEMEAKTEADNKSSFDFGGQSDPASTQSYFRQLGVSIV